MAAPSKDDEISEEDYGDESFEAASPEKPGAPARSGYTFTLQVDGKDVGAVSLGKQAKWVDFLEAGRAKLGSDILHVLYDDKFGEVKEDGIRCKDQEDWEDLYIMMEEDDKHINGKLSLRVVPKKAAPPAQGQKEIVEKTVGNPAADSATSKSVAVPEATVRKVLLAKGKLIEGCAAMDKTGLGLITVAELSKQLQEVAGCSAAEAESLVWSGSAWRDIIPNGKGQMVDYKLFCLCVRLADKEEVALLSNLSNPDLQAARMAVLMQSPAFKDILSECQGAVSPKQCEQLLVDKGTHLMGKKHARALCATPGSPAAQSDMRNLADDLELVDTMRVHRSPLLNAIMLGCVRDYASSNEAKANEALAASADKSSVLPAAAFCNVFEKIDSDLFCISHSLLEAPATPHVISKAVLTPMLSAATGALRQDREVNFETFTNDFSIAHESEIQLLRSGRRETLQDLRRRVLKERRHVEKELAGAPDLENFKKIVMAKPLSFAESEAKDMCADVPKDSKGKYDALEHVKKLQFSEILGTALDECSDALFEKYDALWKSCETKEANGKEGSILMEDFADAMDLVSVDQEKAKKVRQVLTDEGVELVAWRELLECRMRVLSWRELEILAHLRDKEQQAARLKAQAVAARVLVVLADDAAEDDTVPSATAKARLMEVGSLTETEADSVIKMLLLSPLAKQDKIRCSDVLGLKSYIASRDCDSEALKTLMSSRQGFLDACCGSDGAMAPPPTPRQTGPEVEVMAVRSAMHRVHLAAWAVDAVMGFVDRGHADAANVQVGSFFSHMAVVTSSERRRLEKVADGRLQLARLALLKMAPTGASCPKERLSPLLSDLIKKVDEAKPVKDSSSLQAALREGIALALMNMRDSYAAAGKKGSLTCEGLVGSLSAIMCDFDTSLPFPAATELAAHDASVSAPSASSGTAAGGRAKAAPKVASSSGNKGDGMTPGQRVFYLKILKPRKPGIQEMMELMRGMPASISASPMRELQRAGHNLPSAALKSLARESGSSGVLSMSVTLTAAEGVPGTDKLQVLERRARVCLVHSKSKTFVSGAHTMPTSQKKDKGGTEWTFSSKWQNGNPFLVRAPRDADYELYIELAFVTKKKGAATDGQQAINSGDIKEFSAGFGSLRLGDNLKAGKVNLPLCGGTPWARIEVQPKDLEGQKKGGGLMSRFKKPVSQISIEVKMDKESPELDSLPPALVCSYRIKEGLAEFCKLQSKVTAATKLFTRPEASDLVLGTFPAIMNSDDLMKSFAERWDKYAKVKKEDKAAAFRECVSLFYPLVRMDTAKMPRRLDIGPDKSQEARNKVLEDFEKAAKSKEKLVEMLLNNDSFRGIPFRVDELVVDTHFES